MHPSTLIIVISATVLALPFPLPALGGIGGISDTIVGTIDSLLGTSSRHNNHGGSTGHASECRRYDTEPITTCINKCVDLCEDGDADCSACMKGCCKCPSL
ncbi:hypothetical protein F5Y00DRAFT_224617 [Daldinia vernicosa]|uniref:uncharacterized protein n=1 Tax=Daldinia vernicosa TaxID=114800 RepID=UPI002008265C|nr:uncharacterized protein F5Y00DRAFT_224617 [Daldinia vernicosa]KAI0853398.1 hypothetical protein F5Y00DRAFT_224617 [Daldinia vernicosa]